MHDATIRYDEPSDTLYVRFFPEQSATGIELNDQLLLRVDREARRAVGLTVFDFSLLAQQTEAGPRSIALTGLHDLSAEMRDLALELLLSAPVSEFLAVSAYTSPEHPERLVPITSLHMGRITSQAA